MAGDVEVRWKDAPGGERLKPEKGDILMCQTQGAFRLRLASALRDRRFVRIAASGHAARASIRDIRQFDRRRRTFRTAFVEHR